MDAHAGLRDLRAGSPPLQPLRLAPAPASISDWRPAADRRWRSGLRIRAWRYSATHRSRTSIFRNASINFSSLSRGGAEEEKEWPRWLGAQSEGDASVRADGSPRD